MNSNIGEALVDLIIAIAEEIGSGNSEAAPGVFYRAGPVPAG